MPAQTYTHTFIFQFDGQTIEGEMEFDEDGKASYKTSEPIEGLSLSQSMAINNLFNQLKAVFDKFGDIVKIKVEKK